MIRQGEWLSARVIALLTLISLFATTMTLLTASNSMQKIAVASVLVSIIELLGLLLLFWIGRWGKTISRPGLLLFTGIAALGAIRGAGFFQISDWLGLADPADLVTRVFNSMISVSLWSLVLVSLDTQISRLRTSFVDSVAEKSQAFVLSAQYESGGLAQNIDDIQEIRNLKLWLKRIVENTKSDEVTDVELKIAAREVRQAVEQSLRPLSKRIWLEGNLANPRFHWPEVFREALRRLDYNWLVVGAVATLAYLVGSFSLLPPLQWGAQTLGYGLLLFPLLALTKKRSLTHATWRGGALTLVGISVLATLSSELVTRLMLGGQMLSTPLALFIVGPISTFGVLVTASVLKQVKNDFKLLNQLVQAASPSSSEGLLALRFAGFIHNSIQSQLNSLALALERARPDDSASISRIVEDLERLASQSIGLSFAQSGMDPLARIEKVSQAWRGIIDVTTDIAADVMGSPKLGLIVELAEEAISNAVRHSNADSIAIEVKPALEGILVTITHPSSTSSSRNAGVGTQWLERFSQRYEVRSRPAGIRQLQVTL